MESKSELVSVLGAQLMSDEIDPNTLREAQTVVREAKAQAQPRLDESELVVVGTFRPDRRLGGDDFELDRLILLAVRREFHIGELPSDTNANSL